MFEDLFKTPSFWIGLAIAAASFWLIFQIG